MEKQEMFSTVLDEKKKELEQLCRIEEELIAKTQEKLKRVNLINWGLYEKIYQDNDSDLAIYDIKEEKYYIRKPLEISDSDYEKLLEIDKEVAKTNERIKKLTLNAKGSCNVEMDSNTGSGFTALGVIIMIIAFILGFILIAMGGGYVFITWFVGLVVGLVFIAIADILKKLKEINHKLNNVSNPNEHS